MNQKCPVEPPSDFQKVLVAGNIKTAMNEANAKSKDLWYADIDAIKIMPGFNIRIQDDAYFAHIDTLSKSMLKEGYYDNFPIAGFVAVENGKQIVYVTDGHCRFAAVHLANSLGAQIEKLPVVTPRKGTSIEDLTVAFVKTSGSKLLSAYEIAIGCKRLTNYGWDIQQIAERLDFSPNYVEGLLVLVGAPKEVRDMVQNGSLAASTAIQALRTHGDKVVEHLQAGAKAAAAAGTSRVTAKHLPGAIFKKEIKKAAPAMFNTLRDVKADPAYATFSPELREKVEAVLAKLEELEQQKTE